VSQERIIYQCCSMLECDRASLFLIDQQSGELVLQRGKGVDSIRLPASAGIVGHVAQTGETLNVPDAYADARFSKESDKNLRYVTKSILCVPVRDGDGRTIAVLQAINKNHGTFSANDQIVLEKLTMLAGISLRNSQLYEDSKRQQQKVQSLLDVIRTVTSDMGLNSIIFTVTQRFPGITERQACMHAFNVPVE
jgi:GAF domain-containing protein